MTRKYSLNHRLIACILLINLFLQSCENFSNQVIPTIGEEKTNDTPGSTKKTEIIKQLVEQKLTAAGWEVKDLYEEQGELKVKAIERHGNFTSKPHELSVTIAKDIDLEQASLLSSKGQKRLVHFNSPQNGQPGHISILKEIGLLGGMNDSVPDVEYDGITNEDGEKKQKTGAPSTEDKSSSEDKGLNEGKEKGKRIESGKNIDVLAETLSSSTPLPSPNDTEEPAIKKIKKNTTTIRNKNGEEEENEEEEGKERSRQNHSRISKINGHLRKIKNENIRNGLWTTFAKKEKYQDQSSHLNAICAALKRAALDLKNHQDKKSFQGLIESLFDSQISLEDTDTMDAVINPENFCLDYSLILAITNPDSLLDKLIAVVSQNKDEKKEEKGKEKQDISKRTRIGEQTKGNFENFKEMNFEDFINHKFKVIPEEKEILRNQRLDNNLRINNLIRKSATTDRDNCLLDSIFQLITHSIKQQRPDLLEQIGTASEFFEWVRNEIESPSGFLSINGQLQGVRILTGVQAYFKGKLNVKLAFNLILLLADDEGDIGLIHNLDELKNCVSEGDLSVDLRIINVNYNHYEPLFKLVTDKSGDDDNESDEEYAGNDDLYTHLYASCDASEEEDEDSKEAEKEIESIAKSLQDEIEARYINNKKRSSSPMKSSQQPSSKRQRIDSPLSLSIEIINSEKIQQEAIIESREAQEEYELGKNLERGSFIEAINHYRRAAEEGHQEAQKRLISLRKAGLYMNPDQEAMKWYREAVLAVVPKKFEPPESFTQKANATRGGMKLSDLIVTQLNVKRAPLQIEWGGVPREHWQVNHIFGPLFATSITKQYEDSIMAIDPSGNGPNETAYCVAKRLGDYSSLLI